VASAPDFEGAPTGPLAGVEELIGIYDADGGVLGELRYALRGLFSDAHCSLCDLTHRGLRRRKQWDSIVEHLGVPFVLLHRNEMDEAVGSVVGTELPCIVARRRGRYDRLLGPPDLAECGADLGKLEDRIRSAAAGAGPSVRRTRG